RERPFRLACARSKQLRPRSCCPPVCRSCGVRRAIRGHGCLSPKYGRRSKQSSACDAKHPPDGLPLQGEIRCSDARQHQAFAAKLTPGGGLLESGTKKSGDSGWLGSTREAPKSGTPLAARNVSSIRN